MRRRSKASGEPAKTRRLKTVTLKRGNAPKAVHSRSPSIADLQEQLDRRTRERDEALEQQAATAEVLKALSRSTFDLHSVLNTLLEKAVRLCGAEMGVILRQDGEVYRVAASFGHSVEFVEKLKQNPIYQDRGSATGRAVLERRVVHVPDTLADVDYRWGVNIRGEKEMHRTILAAPMLKGDAIIGVIVIRRTQVQPFTDKQIAVLSNFTDQAVIAIENARLVSELHELLQQQTATADVLKIISRSAFDLQPVLEALIESATRLCGATRGHVFQFDGEYLRFAAAYGAWSGFAEHLESHPLRPGPGSIAGRAASERRTIHSQDVLKETGYEPIDLIKQQGYRTVLAVPMLREGVLRGVITILKTNVESFTDKQIEMVETFADQAVIAIENVRLFEAEQQRTRELSESLEQQTATSEVLRVISTSPGDLMPVFEAMLENAVRICGAEFGNLLLRDADTYRVGATYGAPAAYVDFMRREAPFRVDPRLGLGQMLQAKQTYQVADIAAVPTHDDKLRIATIELAGARTVLGVPMLKDDDMVGCIVIFRQEVRLFTEKQIELVQNFAAQAVIAIENARLLNELRQRTTDLTERTADLTDALEQQTATSDVLQVISSSPGKLEPVFASMLENAVRICNATFGNIYRWDGDALHLLAAHNTPPAFAEARKRSPRHPGRNTPAGRAIATKTVVHVADLAAEQAYVEQRDPATVAAVELGGVRAMLSVPMLKENELIGTFALARQEVRPFTDKQIELVENFAAQAVIAIENARLLNELRESLQQQTATSEILAVISNSPTDSQPAFDAIVHSGLNLFPNAVIAISLPDGDKVEIAAIDGADRADLEALRARYPLPLSREYITSTAILNRREMDFADARDTPAQLIPGGQNFLASGYRAITVMPMMRRETAIGAISVVRRQPGELSDKQRDLLRSFANQAVIAIENTRLFNELRESLQQQTATADVLKVISRSAFDLRTVLDRLLQTAAHLCHDDQGTITQRKGDTFYRSVSYGFPTAFAEYVKDRPVELGRDTATGRALVEGKVIHIPDVQADADYTWNEAQRLGGFRTLLGVPMLREGVPVGVLTLTRTDVRPFTAKQIELVSTFADQAAIAIENVRLFENVEARTRELGKSLEDLRTAQDRLVQTEKLASLGQLTAGIAHEIKNPLNFVNNFSAVSVELIDELREALGGAHLDNKIRAEIGEIADTLQGNLDKVVQHGKRADAIVKNMLLHSRQGSGEHWPVDINALVDESLNLAYHGARAEKQGFNITLEKSFDPAAGEVDLFPQEVTRVLLNLISNGFYAATKRKADANGDDYEPTLSAATKSLGDSVEIRIRDNGTGIPPEVKDKLFNPFFTTKPAGEGTGLGLSISHDIIVKQHSGSIEVDTQPGEFTEFRIVLPRAAVSAIKSGGRGA